MTLPGNSLAMSRQDTSERVYGLYVIIDPEVTKGRNPLDVTHLALKGGARMIQLRDKLDDKGPMIQLAREMVAVCREYEALFIVNDHADVALVVEADGLHVGQKDMAVSDARMVLKPVQIIGRSNYLVTEAEESAAAGADYVAIGNVYSTSTKPSISARTPIGSEAIRRAKEVVEVPIVAIGGISYDNVEPVVKAGANAICVSSAVGLSEDPEGESRRLVDSIMKAGGRA